MAEALQTLLQVDKLKVHFKLADPNGWPWTAKLTVKAVDGVSLTVHAGETLGIVGESGCGKSTLARALLNLIPATQGEMVWLGKALKNADADQWFGVRKDVQMIFQDPLASLDPRMTVAQIIAEPLRTHQAGLSNAEVDQRVREIVQQVGLTEQHLNGYPHEFSGGQCQRIGIARALILRPKLIICDEPVSALDVSIQAQIINLLKDLQASMGLALIVIAHDLAVVKHISKRIMVLYLGKTMELADKHTLFNTPGHPYTRALLSAIPIPNPARERSKASALLPGDLPSPINPPSGCVFCTRCPQAQARCGQDVPVLRELDNHSFVACHFA